MSSTQEPKPEFSVYLKAWIIEKNFLEEPWHADEDPAWGETIGEAKQKILSMNSELLNKIGEPLTFLNVPVKRAKRFDKVDFEGKITLRYQAEHTLEVRARDAGFKKMLKDTTSFHRAFIMKGGMYYCSNYCGYTENPLKAGIYTVEDAVRHCLGVDVGHYLRPVLIDAAVHNGMIDTEIALLRTKYVTVVKYDIADEDPTVNSEGRV